MGVEGHAACPPGSPLSVALAVQWLERDRLDVGSVGAAGSRVPPLTHGRLLPLHTGDRGTQVVGFFCPVRTEAHTFVFFRQLVSRCYSADGEVACEAVAPWA